MREKKTCWKFLDQCVDAKKNVLFRRYICVYCSAYCVVELQAKNEPDHCINTELRMKSITTCEGQRYDKAKKT